MFQYVLLSPISVNNRVIVIENRQKNFQLQLQQNRVINYNFVNYNYNFSKPDLYTTVTLVLKFAKASKLELQVFIKTHIKLSIKF